jgi:hypothetical protein
MYPQASDTVASIPIDYGKGVMIDFISGILIYT